MKPSSARTGRRSYRNFPFVTLSLSAIRISKACAWLRGKTWRQAKRCAKVVVMSTSKNGDRPLWIRVSDKERKAIEKAAKAASIRTVSDWCRMVLVEAAKKQEEVRT